MNLPHDGDLLWYRKHRQNPESGCRKDYRTIYNLLDSLPRFVRETEEIHADIRAQGYEVPEDWVDELTEARGYIEEMKATLEELGPPDWRCFTGRSQGDA